MNEWTEEIVIEALKSRGVLVLVKKRYEAGLTDISVEDVYLHAVEKYPYVIQFIENQTFDVCSKAIHKNYHVIRYVRDQTPVLCWHALKETAYAFSYIKNPTKDMCMYSILTPGPDEYERYENLLSKEEYRQLALISVSRDGLRLEYADNQTEEICLEAVRQNGKALKYVINQTKEICLEAVKENGKALKYVRDWKREDYLEIAMVAVKENGLALRYIDCMIDEANDMTEIYLIAINQNPKALRSVLYQTEEICLRAVRRDGMTLEFVLKPSEEDGLSPLEYERVCIAAVRQDGEALRYVVNQTEEICIEAVRQNGCALEWVENQTYVMCLAAVRSDSYSYVYVEERFKTDEIREIANDDDWGREDNDIPSEYIPVNRMSPELRERITELLESHVESEPKECHICYEETTRMGYVFQDCGHDLICIDCIDKLEADTCPFCRSQIDDIIR